MYGSATFTTVMSSSNMKVATQTAIRVHHLRPCPYGTPRRLDGQAAPLTAAASSTAQEEDHLGDPLGRHQRSTASGLEARLAGVSISDGAMTLQRTPSPACSLATVRANASTAAFDAA